MLLCAQFPGVVPKHVGFWFQTGHKRETRWCSIQAIRVSYDVGYMYKGGTAKEDGSNRRKVYRAKARKETRTRIAMRTPMQTQPQFPCILSISFSTFFVADTIWSSVSAASSFILSNNLCAVENSHLVRFSSRVMDHTSNFQIFTYSFCALVSSPMTTAISPTPLMCLWRRSNCSSCRAKRACKSRKNQMFLLVAWWKWR